MSERLFGLPVVRKISASVGERRLNELPVLVIDHPQVRAAVSLQGAQVLAWQPAGAGPAIWLSEQARFEQGRAIRGGVPICWPWFGPAAEPSHGFARLLPWELTDSGEDGAGVTLTMTLRESAQTRRYWPHAFTARVTVRLGLECAIDLEVDGDHESTAALHSYFQVGDIDTVTVAGLGKTYTDDLLGAEGRQEGSLTFTTPLDRVYTQADDVSLINDPGRGRRIEVRHHGQSDVVLWNPGKAGCSDLADGGHRSFACLETARINRPLVSSPGRPARLGLTVRII
ncbi:D-hexose-6-phosphate mutarotase [Kitasatospora sp. NBC_00240]|uniref:D-hexose-6-phosphate mutarotase n=1 Tax=Kitasatospora sp. NBC_00240 TaxID=2903567 RepID=UPI002259B66C|nr:D-hexose-6-phosphate mutarotase [Kitasatospora sp. NBC_00240]MCX5214530.1 D-hexose-6-phosphate mutarotase [Kitasatospora sp. NBC_00240]